MPYIGTTLLIDETVKLQYEDAGGGKIRVYERSNMRKDRYSSLAYNYWVSIQIEQQQAKKQALYIGDDIEMFAFRQPSVGRMVRNGNATGRFG